MDHHDDNDDMFSENFSCEPDTKRSKLGTKSLAKSIREPLDDPDGYYIIFGNELLNDRYEVRAELGRGTFGNVMKAYDTINHCFVAIKIIRTNLISSGTKELHFLQLLADASGSAKGASSSTNKSVADLSEDADDLFTSFPFVKLLDSFKVNGHLCMVLELLQMNMREYLKKVGRGSTVSLSVLRSFASQLFEAVGILEKCALIHADLKPDNILISDDGKIIKLCDFGTTLSTDDIVSGKTESFGPYLVSRFYRAPEIILGLAEYRGIDIWSVGCTLYELFTGEFLFKGRNNNDMLKCIMDYCGQFPYKLLRRCANVKDHFDPDDRFSFLHRVVDPVSNADIVVKIHVAEKPVKDIKRQINAYDQGMGQQAEVNLFADLLAKCLSLNPEKRLTWKEALRHPFIAERTTVTVPYQPIRPASVRK